MYSKRKSRKIFFSSEDYPYKSVLDLIAKRCLAGGTNAWTQTDATCYTINTAGSSGFLNILPFYMDHILFPKVCKRLGFLCDNVLSTYQFLLSVDR